MIVVLAVMWLGFTYLTSGSFISPRNVSNLVRQMAIVGIMELEWYLSLFQGHRSSAGSVMGFRLYRSCFASLGWFWND